VVGGVEVATTEAGKIWADVHRIDDLTIRETLHRGCMAERGVSTTLSVSSLIRR
jgi:hypothetical protein